MKQSLRSLLAALALMSIAVPGTPAFAQAKKPKPPVVGGSKPASKPAAKPATGGSGAIVLGTNQLPGDFGQIGQTYTIGKSDPVNFTLTSAEYEAGRFNAGEETFVPTDKEKLLVLRYTVHNPNPTEQQFDWGSVRFTAVDRKDVNHEYKSAVVRDGTTEKLALSLKPGQKLNVQTVIVVPSDGVIPKLIVQREEKAAVIRYDLRGKVKTLPAPFADPADASGATVVKLAPAQAGVFYPLGYYDVRLDSVAYTTSPLGDGDNAEEPGDSKRYAVFTVTVRNAGTAEYSYDWGIFQPELTDTEGEKHEYKQQILKAAKNATASGNLKPGEEVRLRFFFAIGEGATAKTLTLAGSISGNDATHALVFDGSSLPSK